MRDLITAAHERTIVYDGGMGATLEQFELSLENDYRLPGRCHEALILNRPDVIEGVHVSMLEAGADVLETDTFQASRLKLAEWGLEAHTHEINLKGRPDRPQGRRRAAVRGGVDRGRRDSCPRATTRPSADHLRRAGRRVRRAGGRPAGRGVDLVIIETGQDIPRGQSRSVRCPPRRRRARPRGADPVQRVAAAAGRHDAARD